MSTTSTESTPATDAPASAEAATSQDTATTPEADAKPESKTYDEATVKGLRQEAAKYRTTLREVEAERDALKATATEAQTAIPALTARAEQAEQTALKYRVALDAGLPRNLADRLIGADEEALKADAEALKVALGNAAPVIDLDQGTRTSPPAKTNPNDALRVLALGGK